MSATERATKDQIARTLCAVVLVGLGILIGLGFGGRTCTDPSTPTLAIMDQQLMDAKEKEIVYRKDLIAYLVARQDTLLSEKNWWKAQAMTAWSVYRKADETKSVHTKVLGGAISSDTVAGNSLPVESVEAEPIAEPVPIPPVASYSMRETMKSLGSEALKAARWMMLAGPK